MRMVAAFLAALVAAGCATTDPVSSVVNVAEVWIISRHLDDTPEESLAWLDRRIAQNRKWCHQDEVSACEKARQLEKERRALWAKK